MTAMTPAPQEGQSSGRSGDHANRDPAAPGTTPYHASYIACCPDCCSDLDDEGFDYWCRACQRSWSFLEVALLDESSIDD